jgi:hypothetical protein
LAICNNDVSGAVYLNISGVTSGFASQTILGTSNLWSSVKISSNSNTTVYTIIATQTYQTGKPSGVYICLNGVWSAQNTGLLTVVSYSNSQISSDGTRALVQQTSSPFPIFTSTYNGISWSSWTSLSNPNIGLGAVATSSDLSKIYSAANNLYTYTASSGWVSKTNWAVLTSIRTYQLATNYSGSLVLAATLWNSFLYTSSTNQWNQIYPPNVATNLGVNGTAVSSSGTIMYYTGISGVRILYKSTNSGSTFTSVGYHNQAAFPNQIACSSDGTQVIMGSTIGVYIYNGSTFVLQTNGISSLLSFVSVACNSTMTILMACVSGASGSLYISTNGGTLWTQLTAAPFPAGGTANWTGVASDSTGMDLAACSTGGYIYISSNSGVNWTRQTTLGIKTWSSIAINSDGTQVVASTTNAGIYTYLFSTNNWTLQTSIPTTTINYSALAINGNGTLITAGCNTGGIYTFSPTNFQSVPVTAYSLTATTTSWNYLAASSDFTKIYATSAFGALGVLYSTDSGATFSQVLGVPATSSNRSYLSVACNNNATRIIASNTASTAGIVISTDSGIVWTATGAPSSKTWNSVACDISGQRFIAAASGDYVYVSTDGSGNTWTQLTYAQGLPSSVASWTTVASNFDGSILAACSNNAVSGAVYTNISGVWLQQSISGSTNLWSFIACNPGIGGTTTLIACTTGTGSGVYVYTTLTNTWIQQTGLPTNTAWSSVSCSANGQVLAASTSTLGSQGVYISTNGGTSWTSTGLGARMSRVIVSQDGTKLAAAFGGGFYYTYTVSTNTWTNAGSTTINFSRGIYYNLSSNTTNLNSYLSIAQQGVFNYNASSNTWVQGTNTNLGLSNNISGLCNNEDGTKIYVGSQSRLIYYSANSGSSWTALSGSPNVQTTSMACSGDGNNLIYCGPSGTGVYVYNGTTFTLQTIPNDLSSNIHTCVACNAAFTVFMTCTNGTGTNAGGVYVYSSSAWSQKTTIPTNVTWSSVSCDSTGTFMAACHSGTGYIYISTNGGTSWTQQTQSGLGPFGNGSANWVSVVCSEGTQITAASSSSNNNAGSIYTYLFTTNRWTLQTNVPTNATWTLISSNSDGSVITAAISGGTLYRFTPINTTNTALTMTATLTQPVCVATNSSCSLIYIGTAISSMGIIASTNSGVSFTQLANTYNGNSVIGGNTALNLYYNAIATNTSGTAGQRIITSLISNNLTTLLLSTDSGINWTRLTNFPYIGGKNIVSIQCDSACTSFITALNPAGSLYISTDGSGNTWVQQTVGMGVPTNVNWTCVAASSNFGPTTGILAACYNSVSTGSVYIDISGGTTGNWIIQSSIGTNNGLWTFIVINSAATTLANSIIIACTTGISSGIYLYTGSTATWSNITPSGITNANWKALSCSSSGSTIVAVSSNDSNFVYYSQNTGTSWTAAINKPAGAWGNVNMSSDGTIIIACQIAASTIYKFTIPTTTWTTNASNTISLSAVNWNTINTNPSSSYVIAVAQFTGTYTLSANTLSVQTAVSYYISVSGSNDASIILAASNANVFFSTSTAATTWTRLNNAGNPANASWASMQCFGNSTATVFNFIIGAASGSGPGSLYLFGTNSSGVLTQQTSGVPSAGNYSRVACNTTGSILMACTNGTTAGSGSVYVFSSSAWNVQSTLPTASTWTGVSCSSTGTVMAACVRGGLIYISNNTGALWTSQTQSSLGVSGVDEWQYILVTPDGTQVAVAAFGGNIYTYLFSTNRWTNQVEFTGNWTYITSNNNGSSMYATSVYGTAYSFTPINI